MEVCAESQFQGSQTSSAPADPPESNQGRSDAEQDYVVDDSMIDEFEWQEEPGSDDLEKVASGVEPTSKTAKKRSPAVEDKAGSTEPQTTQSHRPDTYYKDKL